MTIATRDQLIDALAHGMQGFFDKASIAGAVAGRFYSLWRASGVPTNAAIPTAPVACNKNLLGALAFSNAPSALSTHLASVDLTTSNPASTVEIHDRLCHQGGLSGAVTTAQTTNLPLPLTGVSADRIGPDDYSQLQWWLEWYTSTGTTAVNATVTVTYNDNSTGDIVVTLSASSSASGLYQILPYAAGKTGIKAVNSLTLSATTGTAGNFGVTCSRYRSGVNTQVANKVESFDWASLGLPRISDDSCLFLLQLCSTTSTGTTRAVLRFAVG